MSQSVPSTHHMVSELVFNGAVVSPSNFITVLYQHVIELCKVTLRLSSCTLPALFPASRPFASTARPRVRCTPVSGDVSGSRQERCHVNGWSQLYEKQGLIRMRQYVLHYMIDSPNVANSM